LLVFLYVLLIIGALLGGFVARGYPPVLAAVVGLVLAGGAALGAYLARKTLSAQKGVSVTAQGPDDQAFQDTHYGRMFTRWVRWAPPFFLLSGLVMIGALFGLFAATGLPLALVVVVTVIIAGWAVSGAYLARKTSRRLEP
jgi:uncharacterized protein YneF (UPF0154 family)